MDETAVWVRGGTCYLYRAVDRHGKTVDSLLCADRSELSARDFFTKAQKTHHLRWPTKLNLDGNAVVEQDHRAIKRRCAPMLAMKSFRTAATTLAAWS